MSRWVLAPENRGRVVLITVTLFMWLLILFLFNSSGYEKTWQLWRVPTEMPPFVDFRLIPGSAESFLRGFEPTIRNPGDPRDRIFNYPAFWRLFFYSGVTQDDTIWISSLMIVLFFAGVFAFPDRLRVRDAVVVLLVVFSPAAMLLYERGNVDLIVFFLGVLTLLALDYHAMAAAALIMFATVVKIFPFFGVFILLRESKSKFVWLALGCLAVLLGYMYATSKSVSAAWNQTMRGDELSYGANVLFLRYSQFFSDLLQISPASAWMKYGPIVLAFILVAAAGLMGVRSRIATASLSERNLAAFRMGAGIYVGTFLLGNNWDYRLAFLILVVPQLMEWAGDAAPVRFRRAAIMTLVLALASCWHFVFWYAPSLVNAREAIFQLDEFTNWMLAGVLCYLLAASSPDWLRALFRFASPAPETVQRA